MMPALRELIQMLHQGGADFTRPETRDVDGMTSCICVHVVDRAVRL